MYRDRELKFGRRPKHDDFDDLDPNDDRFTGYKENQSLESEDTDESEEVDFDNPDFKKGEMWSDYSEDMDFEE